MFDFLWDITSARFAVTFIIDDELTCCWFLRDSAYKNIKIIFFSLEINQWIRIVYSITCIYLIAFAVHFFISIFCKYLLRLVLWPNIMKFRWFWKVILKASHFSLIRIIFTSTSLKIFFIAWLTQCSKFGLPQVGSPSTSMHLRTM